MATIASTIALEFQVQLDATVTESFLTSVLPLHRKERHSGKCASPVLLQRARRTIQKQRCLWQLFAFLAGKFFASGRADV